MSRGLLFFATENDLKKVLNNINKEFQIEFIESVFYDSPEIKRFTINNIFDLGINKNGDHTERPITVIGASGQIISRKIIQTDGIKYVADNGQNSNSITIWPGGLYETAYIIAGRIDTLHKTEESQKLMKIFRKHFKNDFQKKVGDYYIGNEAETYIGKVRFITINVKSPPEYDLSIL